MYVAGTFTYNVTILFVFSCLLLILAFSLFALRKGRGLCKQVKQSHQDCIRGSSTEAPSAGAGLGLVWGQGCGWSQTSWYDQQWSAKRGRWY